MSDPVSDVAGTVPVDAGQGSASASASESRRALEARLRRRKRRLERLNPVEEPERYREMFLEVIDLEAALHRPSPDQRIG